PPAAGGRCPLGNTPVLGKRMEGMAAATWVRCLFTRSRIPDSVFQPRPGDHEKYGGDPEHPHKIHVITRIKSVIRRPYWEKKIIHNLGLDKAHQPVLHKNIPSVNSKLKVVKHLIRFNTATETTLWVANRRGNVRHLSYKQGRAYH
uniref:Large ribosomal subunit protein uL30m n=1 Tax=Athene cunicularia TaxID=194338 RepID=A0A663LW97_ATHCN